MTRIFRTLVIGGATALLCLTLAAAPVAASAKATPTPKPKLTAHNSKPKKHHPSKPKATPKPPAAPQTVTFKVWGNDEASGTDISYGTSSDQQQTTTEIDSTTWTTTLPYSTNGYYSLDATSQDMNDSSSAVQCSITLDGKTFSAQAGGQSDCSVEVSYVLGIWSAD